MSIESEDNNLDIRLWLEQNTMSKPSFVFDPPVEGGYGLISMNYLGVFLNIIIKGNSISHLELLYLPGGLKDHDDDLEEELRYVLGKNLVSGIRKVFNFLHFWIEKDFVAIENIETFEKVFEPSMPELFDNQKRDNIWLINQVLRNFSITPDLIIKLETKNIILVNKLKKYDFDTVTKNGIVHYCETSVGSALVKLQIS